MGLRDVLADRGCSRIVLCGMGGSSLAPEVICATHGVELTVLDSSDPDYVRGALGDHLESTVVVVSSKSGGTVETDSQKRAYEQAFRDADCEPAAHIIVVTDPGSPLDESATEAGYRVFHADPDVGGRYSALTAFGLVPSGLAGADIGRLLDEAAAIQPRLEADDPDNPALRLGALLGAANLAGVDKVVLGDKDSGIVGFGDWAEQLIAESTGKNGKGILPVVVPSLDAPNFSPSTKDEVLVTIGSGVHMDAPPSSGWGAAVDRARWARRCCCGSTPPPSPAGSSGSTRSTSPTSRAPSRRPATCSRAAARRPSPAFTDGPVEVYATDGLLSGESTVADAVATLLGQLDAEHGYLAVMAYLDRARQAHLAARARPPRRADRTTDHVRLGSALPALDRAVPQGRTTHRRLPPDHGRAAAGPRDPRPAVHLRRLHQRPGDRGRLGARRPRTTGAPAAPHRPEGRPAACCGRPSGDDDRQPAG